MGGIGQGGREREIGQGGREREIGQGGREMFNTYDSLILIICYGSININKSNNKLNIYL